MGRILAIDYGDKRIGLALSDPLKIISSPFEVWENNDLFFQNLDSLIINKKIDEIVIGLPKNMDGSEGFYSQKVKNAFASYENENINKIVFLDERLSSKQATEILHEKGITQKDQKGIKDAYAASIILNEYLEYGG